ncbi:ABC transporter permease [Euzebya tangerina]|uniref:ABC transporter permease n=1 Tax=Euzebya tangerina TaxID=591198 RepID=UPI000E319D1C|nr:ABC transporter permease [Euzebya tangerina]
MSSDVSTAGKGVADPEFPRVPLEDERSTGGADTGREASLWRDAGRQLLRNPRFIVSALVLLVFLFMALFPTVFAPEGVNRLGCDVGLGAQPPGWLDGTTEAPAGALFGLDTGGCPYYERVIFGAIPSMVIGPSVALTAFIIALTFGTLAGYYGGKVDTIISRFTDIILALPLILGALVFITAFRGVTSDDPEASPILRVLARVFEFIDGVTDQRGIGLVVFVLVFFSWSTMLRLARSSVISNRDADYVEAARALGASDLRIMTRHIVPNSLAPILVFAAILVGVAIVGEAALSFLGVGLQTPAISWGLQLSVARGRLAGDPFLMLFPAVFLSVLVFSVILMGDALRDALDPKLR